MKLSGCNRPNRMNMKRISRISFFIYIALLALSCQEKKPSMVEQRREEIRRNDSTELAQAEAELTRIDSLVTYSSLDVEDMKRFIRAMVHFIDMELIVEDAENIPHA